MGYETTMLVVEGHEKKNGKPFGYHSVIASVELSCCGDKGPMGLLIHSRNDVNNELLKEIDDMKDAESECFDADGNWVEELRGASEEEKKRATKTYHSKKRILSERLPYIFWTGSDDETFTDSYGSPLIFATLEEVYEALVRDQAKIIAEEEYEGSYGYRRFHLAIKLLEGFLQDKDSWKNVKVILYGH